MKKYEYRKLRGRIIEKYGTLEAFTKVIGRSKVSVSNKMNRVTGFSQADMVLWGNTLDIRPEEYGEYFFN